MGRASQWTAAALVAAVALVGGCTPDEPEPTGTTSSTGSPTSTSPPTDDEQADSVEVSGRLGGSDVTVTAHPVELGDGWVALTLDWTVPDDSSALFVFSYFSSGLEPKYLTAPRLVDLDESWVAWVGRDSAGAPVTTSDGLVAQPGQTVSGTMFFAEPPGDTVDVLLPYLGLIEDVPVVDADAGTTMPEDLGISWDGDLPSAGIEAFTVAYDGNGSAGVDGDVATVTLASDVLFATDEFALTSQAQARVDEAARAILDAAEVGEVAVVGHTDDRASDDYNLTLSEQRATSVADRLRADLGAGFTVSAEGRGETQPAVEGTSEAARAANRRVEITFQVTEPAAPLVLGAEAAPAATGATATDDPVAVTTRAGSFEVGVSRVVRRGGYLVGTIEVTRAGAEIQAPSVFVPPNELGPTYGRGLQGGAAVASIRAVALLGQGGYVFPADYRTAADGAEAGRQMLGDMTINSPFPEDGSSVVVTVVWPDPGADTASVEVLGLWRITEVPIEG